MALKIEDRVRSVLEFHSEALEPVHHRIRIPFQVNLQGFYPSVNKRRVLVGAFYEGVNQGFYGGTLNDQKFDIDFLNGHPSPGVKPDIIDRDKNLEWEVKGSHYNKESKLTHDQIGGYKARQYSSPEDTFLVAFYRYNLPFLEKTDRMEEDIVRTLTKETLYSVVLPFPVVLKIMENPKPGVNFGRNHFQKDGTAYESCLCISPSALHRFLTNPHESLEMLGFDQNRFEIQRYLSPQEFKINRRELKRFPIVRFTDNNYKEWVEEFMVGYEREMETEDVGVHGLPMFNGSDGQEIPFG